MLSELAETPYPRMRVTVELLGDNPGLRHTRKQLRADDDGDIFEAVTDDEDESAMPVALAAAAAAPAGGIPVLNMPAVQPAFVAPRRSPRNPARLDYAEWSKEQLDALMVREHDAAGKKQEAIQAARNKRWVERQEAIATGVGQITEALGGTQGLSPTVGTQENPWVVD